VPNETIPAVLAAALERWRANERVDGRADLRARVIARKAAELCLARGVLPVLRGTDFVTEVVIPPRSRSAGVVLELATYSHGPVVVRCEYGCGWSAGAIELVEAAVEASVSARGWAPIYVRLWQELLRG
jgi:hypothetical protein